jgi:hypothetical protein
MHYLVRIQDTSWVPNETHLALELVTVTATTDTSRSPQGQTAFKEKTQSRPTFVLATDVPIPPPPGSE